MYPIKQSTAITIPFFAHDANGTAVTGLSDGSFTKRISKGSGAFAAMTVTITEMENGWYSFPLSTTHSNTLGLLTIVFTNAGAKQVNLQWRVEAKLIDDLNDVAATDIVSSGAITTSGGAVSDVTLVGTTTTNTDMRGTELALLAASAPPNFGDLNITSTTGLVNITQTAADKVWGTVTRTLTASTNFNDLSAAEVNAEVDTALADYDGPTNAEMVARTLLAASYFDPAADAVANVTLVGTTTTNTDMLTVAAILASGDVDGFNLEETFKLILSAVAAIVSGAATTTMIFRAADNSRDRITATVDADGNRSAVTLDGAG